MDKFELIKKFTEFLDSVGGTTRESEPTVEICKSVDTEAKEATFVVLKAMKDESEYDLHGDTYSAEEVIKACRSFNENCMQANLGHLVMVEKGTASIVESYTAPVDMMIDDEFIPKDSWLQVWKFADDELWAGVKNGDWNGLSVGCNGIKEDVNE